MVLTSLFIKNAKSKVSVYHLKHFAKVGFGVDITQPSHYRKAVATEAAVAEVLEVVLAVAISASVGIQMA